MRHSLGGILYTVHFRNCTETRNMLQLLECYIKGSQDIIKGEIGDMGLGLILFGCPSCFKYKKITLCS